MRKVLKNDVRGRNCKKCVFFQWEDNIAEAARIGVNGEDELQWDAYAILKETMYQDQLQAIEMEKETDKQKQKDKRAPKLVEQKKKISEAVRANGKML